MLAQREGLLSWATGRLIEHDTRAPGVIRRLCASGPMRRQAVFAVVAAELAAERHRQIVGDGEVSASSTATAEVLRECRAREVIALATGSCVPEGLLGALERVGLKMFRNPSSYRRLIEVYSTPSDRHIARALEHVGQIHEPMLAVADALPPWLVFRETLLGLHSAHHARQFAQAVEYVQAVNSKATPDALISAIEARQGNGRCLGEVLPRFLRRADHPLSVPPIAHSDVTMLRSVRDLIATAREYQNCLGQPRQLIDALSGERAFGVFNGVVMEFIRLSDGAWLFRGCHGPLNMPVEDEIEEAAQAICEAAGIAFVRPYNERHGALMRYLD